MSALITYLLDDRRPEKQSHDLAGNPNLALLGLYEVRFDDGFCVMLPHMGVHGTISEEPAHDNPEVRARLLAMAERIRLEAKP